MSYVVTFTRRAGARPQTIRVNMNEKQARLFCANFAKKSRGHVVLHSEDGDGVSHAVGRWEAGVAKRHFEAPADRAIRPTIVEGEVAEDEQEAISADDDEMSSGNHDDEYHTYSAYCVKCGTNREFVGRVVELKNGSRAARGTCPVCGSGVSRMVKRTTPLDDEATEQPDVQVADAAPELDTAEDEATDEDDDTDEEAVDEESPEESETGTDEHILVRETSRRGTHLSCSAGDWERWVKARSLTERNALSEFELHQEMMQEELEEAQAPEVQSEISEAIAEAVPAGVPMDEIAAATANLAAEFSEAAQDTEQAPVKPKRGKKATAKTEVSDAEVKAVQEMPVAQCPYCNKNVPVKTSGDGKLQYVMVHPGNGRSECVGSRATVKNGEVVL